jgi:hypothetical protein
MSRQTIESVSPRAWRATLATCVALAIFILLSALLITSQDQSNHTIWKAAPFDQDWTIQAGALDSDRLVLRPADPASGVALHPIETDTFGVQARVSFDAPAGSAGLIVQAADADHFSAFLISNDGYFRFGDYRNGVWIDRVAWHTWPHIRRDGAANWLRAECAAQACTFFVNDEWTLRVEDLPPTRWLGFVAQTSKVGTAFEADFEQLEWRP